MILLAHPFGNANVRAVLRALHDANLLVKFVTTLGWSNAAPFASMLPRRGYDLPGDKIHAHPFREIVRLLAATTKTRTLIEHERGWASIDQVWRSLDSAATRYLSANYKREQIDAVYAYEDCALGLFRAAQDLRVRR